MDTNNINKDLEELYSDYYDTIKSVYQCKNVLNKDINPLLIKCPSNYYEEDNIRIMFIELGRLSWFEQNKCNDIHECMDLYSNFHNELPPNIVKFMQDVNNFVNVDKTNNYIYSSIFKGQFVQDIEIKDKTSNNNDQILFDDIVSDLLAKEIELLNPELIFFISDIKNVTMNYYFGKIFKTETELGYNNAIIGSKKFIPYYCFKIESVNEQLNYEVLSEYIQRLRNSKKNKIRSIQITNYHSHTNTQINNIGNLLVLVGKNDVGKTSILEALDSVININNNKTFDSKSIIKINGLEWSSHTQQEVNFHLFRTETFDLPDTFIGNKTIHQLINDKIDNNENQAIIEILKKEVNSLFNDNKIELSDETTAFLQQYHYLDLINQSHHKELLSKKSVIERDLKAYISRKSDISIVENWKTLLNELRGNDDIPICKRGAGIRRLCSLFVHTVDAYRNNSKYNVPTVFAIDEIELSLHPNQQRQLVDILKSLSREFQIIITTHSPFVVKELGNDYVDSIIILKKDLKGVKIESLKDKLISYGDTSKYVSLNEINYHAFDEASEEFHQELFGFIQSKLGVSVDGVDTWLFEQKYAERKKPEYDFYFVNPDTGQLIVDQKGFQHREKTLPYCVRNQIDHPHIKNLKFCNYDYVNLSIEIMKKVIQDIPKLHKKYQIIPLDNPAKGLTGNMTIVITTKHLTKNPFYANKDLEIIKNEYNKKYGFDYKKACCHQNDFTFKALG